MIQQVLDFLRELDRSPGRIVSISYQSMSAVFNSEKKRYVRGSDEDCVIHHHELADQYYEQLGKFFCGLCNCYCAILSRDQYFTKRLNLILEKFFNLNIFFRELYYSNTRLFRDQSQSNRILDTLCDIFNCSRMDLRVVGSPRGLVEGNLTYVINDSIISCHSVHYFDHFFYTYIYSTFFQSGHISPLAAWISDMRGKIILFYLSSFTF